MVSDVFNLHPYDAAAALGAVTLDDAGGKPSASFQGHVTITPAPVAADGKKQLANEFVRQGAGSQPLRIYINSSKLSSGSLHQLVKHCPPIFPPRFHFVLMSVFLGLFNLHGSEAGGPTRPYRQGGRRELARRPGDRGKAVQVEHIRLTPG